MIGRQILPRSRGLSHPAPLLAGCLVTALFFTGCQMSPVSPSAPIGPAAQGANLSATVLRWDLTAADCSPQRPAPEVPAEPTSLTESSPGVVQGLWDRPGERAIFAEFHGDGAVYALCSWDTTGF